MITRNPPQSHTSRLQTLHQRSISRLLHQQNHTREWYRQFLQITSILVPCQVTPTMDQWVIRLRTRLLLLTKTKTRPIINLTYIHLTTHTATRGQDPLRLVIPLHSHNPLLPAILHPLKLERPRNILTDPAMAPHVPNPRTTNPTMARPLSPITQ